MTRLAVLKKKRTSKEIRKANKIFGEAITNEDYELAAKITFLTMIKEFGKKGILLALKRGNSFYKRLKMRRGLKNEDSTYY
jgi:hypothetical protein